MKPPVCRHVTLLTASLLMALTLAACDKNGASRRALIGKWEGVRLTREIDGHQAEIGTFGPGACIIEYFQDGEHRVESRGAPDFSGEPSAREDVTPLVFSGRFEVDGTQKLRLTIQEVSSPTTRKMIGKTDDMRFMVDDVSLVTFGVINDPTTGKRIGTMEASYKRVGLQSSSQLTASVSLEFR